MAIGCQFKMCAITRKCKNARGLRIAPKQPPNHIPDTPDKKILQLLSVCNFRFLILKCCGVRAVLKSHEKDLASLDNVLFVCWGLAACMSDHVLVVVSRSANK